MSENKSNDFSNNYKLSVENMWSVTRGETGNWGIEGYEVPKEYFDHIKTKKGKEIWESIISTKPKSYWPPKLDKDDNDKPIWPKRPNFIEDVRKWANSYYDKEKSERIVEELKGKDKNWDKPPEKKQLAHNLQGLSLQGDRKTNIDWIIHNEKKKYLQYADREDKINELREKLEKERKEKKSKIGKIMETYKVKGSLPKCERITIVADSEHMGEKLPFCSEGKKKEEKLADDENKPKSNKSSYNTVFPNVLPTWNKAPVWGIYVPVKKEEEIFQRKKDMEDERYRTMSEKYMTTMKKKDLNIELSQTYNKIINFKKINIGFGKTTSLNEEEKEIHSKWTQDCPKKCPGPQHYWKTLPYSKLKNTKNLSKSESKYTTVENSDGSKTLMIDRKVAERATSKPMSSYIF